MRSGLAVLCQHAGGCAMLVCSQPWVTAKSRAASREVKAFVKAEHADVAAVALGSVDGKRGAEEAAAVGRMCRGRNDERAHGNGCL